MSTLTQQISAARRAGTPLVIVRGADPAATITRIVASLNGSKATTPVIQWDVVRGPLAGDEFSNECLTKSLAEANLKPEQVKGPAPFLAFTRKLPPQSIIFMMNLHRFCENEIGVIQSLWNLRDEFKGAGKCIIGLCPNITLPAELSQDMLVLDEPLPTDAELKLIANDIYIAGQLEAPTDADLDKIADATLGLAAFPAEQSMAMSLTKKGMNMEDLWSRKKSVVEQAPGLSVWRGGENFADIGGCQNVKDFLASVISGKNSPRAVVFIDEIEKAIGTGQDTSGVSQELLGNLLTWMQDNNADGCIFIGPPGAAKSALAKATGNEAGIPTISMDMGGMKNSLVGESGARFRTALKVIDAVSQKRTLFIATCNSIGILPPELRRRFTFGTFYFELPDEAERAAIWEIYRRKYEIPATYTLPADEGWTGAEIKQCCNLSSRLKKTLEQCAGYIVPVAVSAAEQIKTLRQQADGKFVSASYPGVYKMNRPTVEKKSTRRNLTLAE